MWVPSNAAGTLFARLGDYAQSVRLFVGGLLGSTVLEEHTAAGYGQQQHDI